MKSFIAAPLAMGLAAVFPAIAAASPNVIMPSMQRSASFAFATAVQTPKGRHAASGTITVTRTGSNTLTLTVQEDGGKPPRTIPLIVAADGSISRAATAPAPEPNDEAGTEAATLQAQLALAAHVGIAARKNGGANDFAVPITLTPVGRGTAVSAQLQMRGDASRATYSGQAEAATTTQLPPGGNLDPAEIAKSIGVAAVAHHAFTPAGRAVTAAAMYERRQKQKKAASGVLADALKLSVSTQMRNGRLRSVQGTQTDTVTISGRPVAIVSTWSFTGAGSMKP